MRRAGHRKRKREPGELALRIVFEITRVLFPGVIADAQAHIELDQYYENERRKRAGKKG